MLDRLGGGAWQSRKARLKKRLRDMAGAADPHRRRAADARRAELLIPPDGLYDEFCGALPL